MDLRIVVLGGGRCIGLLPSIAAAAAGFRGNSNPEIAVVNDGHEFP